MILGFGPFAGSLLWGWLGDVFRTADGAVDFSRLFLAPAALALAAALLMAVAFHPKATRASYHRSTDFGGVPLFRHSDVYYDPHRPTVAIARAKESRTMSLSSKTGLIIPARLHSSRSRRRSRRCAVVASLVVGSRADNESVESV